MCGTERRKGSGKKRFSNTLKRGVGRSVWEKRDKKEVERGKRTKRDKNNRKKKEERLESDSK
jgi:hypothetical protein